jgi:hypothetical protein
MYFLSLFKGEDEGEGFQVSAVIIDKRTFFA